MEGWKQLGSYQGTIIMALKLASEKQVLGEIIELRTQGNMEAVRLTVSLKAIYPLVGTLHLYSPYTLCIIKNGLYTESTTIDASLLLSALETMKLLDRISK